MLGTGHALVTECYNTCFVLSENDRYFLVDGGGGSALLRQLKHAGIDWRKIKGVFVTHQHLDHITGIIWILRVVCSEMNKNSSAEDISIYAHAELIKTIDELGKMHPRWLCLFPCRYTTLSAVCVSGFSSGSD